MNTEVTVIGAGVSGLTTGIRLVEAGFKVKIIASQFAPNITSSVAAAIWYPYLVESDPNGVMWGLRTIEILKGLMVDVATTGVSKVPLVEVFTETVPIEEWKWEIEGFHILDDSGLPDYRFATEMMVPFMDTSVYLRYLTHRFSEKGTIEPTQPIRSINELMDGRFAPLVVNCSGEGAGVLCSDDREHEFQLVRGQVVVVRAPQIKRYVVRHEVPQELAYVFPRRNDVILGGTEEQNSDPLADKQIKKITKDIKRRCFKLVPDLGENPEILDVKEGFRPVRVRKTDRSPVIRVERQVLNNNRTVIHNYGHGGAGFTLSWGCADEVLNLVRQWAS